jgi:hypothetical protein
MGHQPRKMASQRRSNVGFDLVAEAARVIPDVEEVASPRGRGLKIRGKLLACQAIHKSAEPNSLMVRIGSDEREVLLATQPDTYYLTDHYRGYPAILVRLSKIRRKALGELLEIAAEFVGAKKRRAAS